jgi:hypothetical protein
MSREGYNAARARPLRFAALVCAAFVVHSTALAQSAPAPATLDDAQVQSFFDSVQRDQALAGQAGVYAPAPGPIVPPAVAPARPVDDAAVPKVRSASEIGLGLDQELAVIPEEPPGPVETALLLLAALGVLIAASAVVLAAIRHLRREARLSKRTYRRRMHRSRHRRVAPATEATSH